MTITEQVERLQHLSVVELLVEYRQLYGKEPRSKNREFLWKRCAWKQQEREFGGLSDVARRRLEELIAEIKLPIDDRQRTVTGKLTGTSQSNHHAVGVTFTRTWRGREVRATAVENGFEVDGVVHRSLSAAAAAITGSHLSGKAFFGLTKRKAAR